jgi:hypothetical protein
MIYIKGFRNFIETNLWVKKENIMAIEEQEGKYWVYFLVSHDKHGIMKIESEEASRILELLEEVKYVDKE